MPRKRRERRARLMDTVAAPSRGVVSHAQRLPPELLAEIFLHYLAPVVPSPDDSQLRKLSVVLLIGHICSGWRHVAYTTPKLWTQLSLDVKGKETKVDHVSFVKAWLSRAHPYPLSVSLLIETETKSLSRILGRIVGAILPSAHRLQNLKLALPFPYFEALVNIPTGSMPLLENLLLSVIIGSSYCGGTSWVTRVTAFKAAPRLCSVSLLCLNEGLFGHEIYMPWSQLTELCIMEGGIPSDVFWDAFSRCVNLVDCQLNFMDGVLDDLPFMRVVSLPHLQKLDITFTGPGDLSPFFQPLYLPALKDLSISTLFDCDWDDHDIFMEFTVFSSLDLERLCLNNVEMDSDELLEFLPRMHSIVELKITKSECIDDDLVDALFYHETDGSDQHLIPRLKTLVLSEVLDELDGDNVANMIESRWWTDDAPRAVSRLECVHVDFGCKVEVGVRQRLIRFRQQGLDIRIRSSGKEWDNLDT